MVEGKHQDRAIISTPRQDDTCLPFPLQAGRARERGVSADQKCRLMGAFSYLGCRLSVATALSCCPVLPLAEQSYPIPAHCTPPPGPSPAGRGTRFSTVRASDSTWGGGQGQGGQQRVPAASLTQPHRTNRFAPEAALVASWHQRTKPSTGSHKQKAGARRGDVNWA